MVFAQLVLERETLRRRAVEVIVSQIRKYLISSVGSLQVCAGHEAGCELIIHAMHKIYEEESSNFTSRCLQCIQLSQQENISTQYRNYNLPTGLFIIGGREIRSTEGKTQGDPTAKAIYAIAITTLILMIVDITHQDDSSTKTAAYADDFTAANKMNQLKK